MSGQKTDLPKMFESTISKPRFISATASTSPELKNISMNLGLENSTFQHLGK